MRSSKMAAKETSFMSEISGSKKESILVDTFTQTISSLIAAVIIGAIALFSADKFFSTPQLSGLWAFEIQVENTSYKPFKNLKVTYKVTLAQSGLSFSGTGEKYSEQLGGVEKLTEISGKNRTPISIEGSINKNFLSKDEVFLTISEEGTARKSSTFQRLIVNSEGQMAGMFESTIAENSGTARWRRK
jgi:hypothetical protein